MWRLRRVASQSTFLNEGSQFLNTDDRTMNLIQNIERGRKKKKNQRKHASSNQKIKNIWTILQRPLEVMGP